MNAAKRFASGFWFLVFGKTKNGCAAMSGGGDVGCAVRLRLPFRGKYPEG
jgi:hypothetical protein